MAEFCRECWEKIYYKNCVPNNNKYILTSEYELCEGCGKWKKVVIKKKEYRNYNTELVLWLFRIIGKVVNCICKSYRQVNEKRKKPDNITEGE